jgi:hypothetical protein
MYELLTGSTPFDKKRSARPPGMRCAAIIREEDPPKPSTRLTDSRTLSPRSPLSKTEPAKLTKLVAASWMVMKCLEKDRNRR